jgi:hypothetical protein
MSSFHFISPHAAAMRLMRGEAASDADARALAQAAAQAAEWAAKALARMPPPVVERLPDDVLRALAQAAAQEAWSAALALGGMPPQVVARLSDDDLRALAQAAVQKDGWAAQTLRSLTTTLRQDDPAAQARAARLSVAVIAAAADVLSADDLIAWAQEAPLEALARTEALAALLARAQRDPDAAPLLMILETRIPQPDAPPTPSPPIARRRGRGRR